MSKPREFWISKELDGKTRITTKEDAEYMANAIMAEPIHVIEKSAADKLAEALEKCKGAMKYAYEDHVDEFYMNHLRDIEQALKEYRGEK